MLTMKELTELFKVSRATIYKMIDKGDLAFVRISGQLRFLEKDVEEYIGRHRVKHEKGVR